MASYTTSFTVNKADFEFILKQIKIAEATSEGYTPAVAPVSILQAIQDAYGISAANAAIAPFGLRTVDGSFNNLLPGQTDFGAADTLFPRLTTPVYRNELDEVPFNGVTNTNYGVGGNVVDTDPRIISNLIVDMTAGNPAAVLAALNYSVFSGAITGSAVAAAAAAIKTAYALTKTTDNAEAAARTIEGAAALAVIAGAKATLAAAAVNALAAELVAGPVDPADTAAMTAAVAAATAALTAAQAVAARLAFPGGVNVTAAEIAAAALVVANATTLRANLLLLQTALADANVSAADDAAATAAAALAGTVVTNATASTAALNTVLPSTATAIAIAALAAVNADADLATLLTSNGIEFDPLGSLVIPNLSPDIGLSPGFNSWMTFFGQFFDHGLDLLTKGGNGTVLVPLAVDDPLIAGADGAFGTADDLPASLRFMALTRATPTMVGGVAQHENTTTSFVDQNQTYTSQASHQVFLREYATSPIDGKTVSTGRLIEGSAASGSVAGAIGNWAEVKAQALQYLGIRLTDFDVHNVPLLRTDQYGKFLPHPVTGYAQVIVSAGGDSVLNTADDVVVSGTPLFPVDLATVVVARTGHAFLNDIAHHASPSFIDFNRDGIQNGADYRQVADANFDRDNNGIYNLADLDLSGDGIVTLDEIQMFVADVNHDGVVNLADVDRNGDGSLTAVDFDIDGNGIVNAADLVANDNNGNTYDNEMLNAHFVTGDGRGNENIALTTVHSIFHSEHNRLVEVNKITVLQSADLTFINEWLLTDLTAVQVAAIPTDPAALLAYAGTLNWDGERLFQAARFGTEMQYQHMVFEEFARRIQPMIDPFIFNSTPNVNPSIVAEFAHTVYRFGHSMLTGTVDRLDNTLGLLNGDMNQQTLLAVFLNPQAYVGSGATLQEINANIIRGLSRDVGNAIDEFIVQDVRSNLLGLPLDLAVLNLARGRETGIPSLNQARAQLYNDTGLADLKPYTSWSDFALNMKNAASIVNFIAAYGTHSTITGTATLAGKRAAAEDLVFNTGAVANTADRTAFLNGTGTYAGDLGGLNLVDMWIGGLAERNPEFGGMLGTTFNYVFEKQMENLQFGDRLYYLTRTQGLNFLNQLEPNTFADMIMRNTALGDIYSTHLNGQLFVTPDHIIELDRGIAQTDYNGADPGNDPTWVNPFLGPKVVRDYSTSTIVDVTHDFGGYLRVLGGEHYVLGGTEGNDTLIGDSGIDTLWGDGGNDYLNGMTESDDVFGGAGDDIIEDPFGNDVLRGQAGNDVVTSARGADLLFGDDGQDYIVLGQDAAEAFGGTGADFILGGAGKDFIFGNEGDDWIEGGAGFDTLAGENSDLFFNSPIIGHDVMFGQGDETDYDAESGDDIMGSGPSVFRYEGMFGFDWGIGKGDLTGVAFDLQIPVFTTVPQDVLRDRFDLVEGLSGWKFSDVLEGDARGSPVNLLPPGSPLLFTDHVLTAEGIDRITGLRQWLEGANTTDGVGALETLDQLQGLYLDAAGNPVQGTNPFLDGTNFRDGNILMGGDGNDLMRGRGGNDLIDGDAWLNVRIKIVIASGPNAGTYSAESMNTDVTVAGEFAGKVFNTFADGTANFASPAFGGRSLTSLMLDRTINPGQLSIVREIRYDDTNPTGLARNIDTAAFFGNLAEYAIEGRTATVAAADLNGDGFISVTDLDNGLVAAPANATGISRGLLTDGTDLLKNIEMLRFADQDIVISSSNNLATGVVTISDRQNTLVNPANVPTTFDIDGSPATPALATPHVGQVLTASVAGVVDADGFPQLPSGVPVGVTFEWQTAAIGGLGGWTTITTGNAYTVRPVDAGQLLRAVAVFQDNNGTTERIVSPASDGVTVAFRVDENSVNGTVIAASIPFNPATDPAQTPGGPTAVDIVALTHVLVDNAGGRFQLVTVGGVQQLRVLGGGVVALNYEVDNEYQIVINSYISAAAATALDPAGLLASRQFTVLLNNLAELPLAAPADIQWGGVTPDNLTLPGAGAVIANLTSVDPDTPAGHVYSLLGGSSAGFTVSGAGVVTAVNAMAANTTYTLNISSTDTTGNTRTETFNIRTNGIGNSINLNTFATVTDDILYASQGDDNNVNGLDGNDILFGQQGIDTLNGGAGNDILVGGEGNDIVNGDAGNDIIRHTVDVDGGGAVNGGADSDTLVLTSGAGNQNLNVILNLAGVIANFEGGTVTGVESVTADLGAGTGDTLTYTASGGVTVNLTTGTATGFTSIANIENVTSNGGSDTLTGNAAANVLSGGGAADVLNGGGGNDSLNGGGGNDILNGDADNDTLSGAGGSDILVGGAGNDMLIGGQEADTLIGGTGNDIFDFNNLNEVGVGLGLRDVITDYAAGEIIDLVTMDANTALAGNQAFSNVAGAAFSAAAQVRYVQVGADTLIQGNIGGANGNAADFEILLQNYTGAVTFNL